jgi:hypothetical protein
MSSSKAVRSRQIELSHSPGSIATAVASSGPLGVVVGEIVEYQPDGTIFVDYPDNTRGPLLARTVIEEVFPGAKVLLAFEMGVRTLPIVLGIVHDRGKVKGKTVRLQADRIIVTAQSELLLQCGESHLEARRDGTVRLKGTDVVSHATRTNKIRGATVRIN